VCSVDVVAAWRAVSDSSAFCIQRVALPVGREDSRIRVVEVKTGNDGWTLYLDFFLQLWFKAHPDNPSLAGLEAIQRKGWSGYCRPLRRETTPCR